MKKTILFVILAIGLITAKAQTNIDTINYRAVMENGGSILWPDSVDATGIKGYLFGTRHIRNYDNIGYEICQLFEVPQFNKWQIKEALIDIGAKYKNTQNGAKLKVYLMKVDTINKICPLGPCFYWRTPRPIKSQGAVIDSAIINFDSIKIGLTSAKFTKTNIFYEKDTFAIVVNYEDFYHFGTADSIRKDTIAIKNTIRASGFEINGKYNFSFLKYNSFAKNRWIWVPTNELLKNSDFIFCIYPIAEKNVGINDISNNKELEIYPNPATDVLNITAENNSTVKIYSISGQLVKQFTSASLSSQVNISDLKAGIYTIEVSNDREVKHSKFVKE